MLNSVTQKIGNLKIFQSSGEIFTSLDTHHLIVETLKIPKELRLLERHKINKIYINNTPHCLHIPNAGMGFSRLFTIFKIIIFYLNQHHILLT